MTTMKGYDGPIEWSIGGGLNQWSDGDGPAVVANARGLVMRLSVLAS
jgi:hypothetical protein